MNQAIQPAHLAPASQRDIVARTQGRGHRGITRLVSPGDLGALIKPFVFLDLFRMGASHGSKGMGMHPHSGIATVTVVMEGAIEYRETTGQHGVLSAGGVEFMNAGGGVWHGGSPHGDAGVAGFQLWLALPAEDENGPAHSQYLAPEQVQSSGPARVILGSYQGVASLIQPRAPITYLHVKLRDGEQWTYQPPAGHDVAWTAVGKGVLATGAALLESEVAVFDEGGGALQFTARGDTEFVLGSAAKHPYPLVTGMYSVHTSATALLQGENEISRIGNQLHTAGLI
ncbi:pirin [Massilia sp. Root418]|jgi:redox-sensitive bicupin YhaK (pirin superfamily)|uniref:pirin family protein n=1 Tax=Massilia sp. Root418 TaxID=1736532 RepID=UPI0006F5F328|nr:pirin family protein [Massilia sp. Root418]KQW89833.1 pirin [Massilia sp. Root418]